MKQASKMTIEDAIKAVLADGHCELSVPEITERILANRLYNFKAKDSQSVVNHTLRKSCIGIDLKISKREQQKSFCIASKGKYKLNSALK